MVMNTNMKSSSSNPAVLAEEKKILGEIKAEERKIEKAEALIVDAEKKISRAERHITTIVIVLTLLIAAGAGGLVYWRFLTSRISIDKAIVSAPQINIGPSQAGILQDVFVNVGDTVPADTVVARVDTQSLKTTVAGLVIDVNKNIGKRVLPTDTVVSVIDPNELRVVGTIAEDKGLADIQVGQRAVFTVDAFGSRAFYGTVDNVSPTSHDSGVVFNISDKRETREFDVTIRYDGTVYPELRNGMSAKVTILKN